MRPAPTVDMSPDLDTLAELGQSDETVRIAVLGMQGVGKSAITVRYLTHRFIGEYKSNTDMMYHQVIKLDGSTIKVDIIDVSTSVQSGSLVHHNIRNWAEGFLLVYSVTTPESFQHASQLLEEVRRTGSKCAASVSGGSLRAASVSRESSKSPAARRKRSGTPQRPHSTGDGVEVPAPAILVGNKTDLIHLNQVDTTRAQETASRLCCQHEEVSASESAEEITALFHAVIRQCLALKRRRSGMDAIRNAFSSLPRAGRGSSREAAAAADSGSSLRRRRPRGRLQLPPHGETQLVDIVSPVELRPTAAAATAREPEGRTSDGESVCSGATSSGSSGGSAGSGGSHTPQPGAPPRKFSVFDVGRKLGSFISGGSRPSTPAPSRFTTSPLKTSVPDLSKTSSLSEKLDTLKKSVKKVSV
ncbi:protein ras-2-like [Amphibalanus amphitrite]|uniref:protein ras-2-like n=1 Tax=Amphibalanus amphitrite TaxID=1232801 RepID=UPI001C921FA1|nr:protein ras-2-like [Amphibalanus amphitrite]